MREKEKCTKTRERVNFDMCINMGQSYRFPLETTTTVQLLCQHPPLAQRLKAERTFGLGKGGGGGSGCGQEERDKGTDWHTTLGTAAWPSNQRRRRPRVILEIGQRTCVFCFLI